MLAPGIHTAGFLGKFFSESMEHMQPGIYEAVTSSGASFPQKVVFAGWPSVLPEIAGQTLYVFDRNIRVASVLGLVGAGGIGSALHVSLQLFNYRQASALILIILITLIAADYASGWLRHKIARRTKRLREKVSIRRAPVADYSGVSVGKRVSHYKPRVV